MVQNWKVGSHICARILCGTVATEVYAVQALKRRCLAAAERLPAGCNGSLCRSGIETVIMVNMLSRI